MCLALGENVLLAACLLLDSSFFISIVSGGVLFFRMVNVFSTVGLVFVVLYWV
jgi:hypothetical protein